MSDDKGKAGSAALAHREREREAAAAAALFPLSLYVTQRAKGLRPAGYFVIVSSEKIHHGGSWLQMGRENKSADATGWASAPHGLSNAHQARDRERENEKLIRPVRSICQRACQSNFCSLLGLAMGARGWLTYRV